MSKNLVPLRLENYIKDIPGNATEDALIRYFRDMDKLFQNHGSVPNEENPELYRFWTIEPAAGQPKELAFGMTSLNSGTIDGEYFMTHGHYHAGAGAEIYICFEGEGLLLLQTREGEYRLEEFSANNLVYIPSGWGHRTINVGHSPLCFGAIWPTGIEHDYDAMYTADFKVRVFQGPNGPEVIEQD